MSLGLAILIAVYIAGSVLEVMFMRIYLDNVYDDVKYMICPTVVWSNEISDNKNLNAVGRIILCVLLTLLSIPGLLIWYCCLLITYGLISLGKCYVAIFKKKTKNK